MVFVSAYVLKNTMYMYGKVLTSAFKNAPTSKNMCKEMNQQPIIYTISKNANFHFNLKCFNDDVYFLFLTCL